MQGFLVLHGELRFFGIVFSASLVKSGTPEPVLFSHLIMKAFARVGELEKIMFRNKNMWFYAQAQLILLSVVNNLILLILNDLW